MAPARKRRAARALACVTLVAGVLALPVSAGADTGDTVIRARKLVSTAAGELSSASDRVSAIEARIGAAKANLTSATRRAAQAKGDVALAHRRTLAAADVAQRTARASALADKVAFDSRSALMRLARDAYAGSLASNELMMLASFFLDGSASLGDFSQETLAIERTQNRLIETAEATAAEAGRARVEADAAASDHRSATESEDAAKAVLQRTRLEKQAAADSVRGAGRELGVARAAVAKARARYAAAGAAFKRAFLEACRSGGSPLAPRPPPPSSGTQAPLVWQILLANGFSKEAAAGVLGNLQQESNVDPTTQQNGGPGMGLAQWSRGGRWDSGPRSLMAFASVRGLDPWDARTQVQFMLYEMGSGWGDFDLAAFKKSTDISRATVYFHDVFERSADSSFFVATVRVGYAHMWYATLSGTAPSHDRDVYAEPILVCPGD